MKEVCNMVAHATEMNHLGEAHLCPEDKHTTCVRCLGSLYLYRETQREALSGLAAVFEGEQFRKKTLDHRIIEGLR